MENPFLQDNAVANIVSWHMNAQNEPLTCHSFFYIYYWHRSNLHRHYSSLERVKYKFNRFNYKLERHCFSFNRHYYKIERSSYVFDWQSSNSERYCLNLERNSNKLERHSKNQKTNFLLISLIQTIKYLHCNYGERLNMPTRYSLLKIKGGDAYLG